MPPPVLWKSKARVPTRFDRLLKLWKVMRAYKFRSVSKPHRLTRGKCTKQFVPFNQHNVILYARTKAKHFTCMKTIPYKSANIRAHT